MVCLPLTVTFGMTDLPRDDGRTEDPLVGRFDFLELVEELALLLLRREAMEREEERGLCNVGVST